MVLGIKHPGWNKCPRCRSGNIFEVKIFNEEVGKKREAELVSTAFLPKLICQSCDYQWHDLAT